MGVLVAEGEDDLIGLAFFGLTCPLSGLLACCFVAACKGALTDCPLGIAVDSS